MTITIDSNRRTPRAAFKLSECLGSQRCYWLFLAIYLIAHIALRLWETPNIGKNEVQEAIAAQGWAWGYHPRNPPLHTWLLMGSYGLFGANVLAHTVLKYVLLGALYAFAYLSGRRLLKSPALAALSALSLMLLGPFAWTVHTAWTHTLLLAVSVFATFWAALRLDANRRLTDYLLFGVMIGAGLLAKYSFLLFLGPLLAAMAITLQTRSVLFDRRMLASLALAAVLIAPHAIWMATAKFDFAHFLAEVEHIDDDHSYVMDLALGFGDVAYEALAFLFPFALIFPVLFRKSFTKALTAPSGWGTVATLVPALSFGLLALNIFAFRATNYEVRYMLCALLLAPLAAFMWLERREHSERAFAWLTGWLVAIAVIGLGALTARAEFYHSSCRRCYDEMPIERLVSELRNSGFGRGTIVTPDYYIGGNMRLAFPAARVIATNYYVQHPPVVGAGQCLLVWDARIEGDAIPESVAQYLQHTGVTPTGAPRYVEALLHRDRERRDRFAYWPVENADANCRPVSSRP